MNRSNSNLNVTDYNYNQLNFDKFGEMYIEIYKQYIECNRAPYELNISGELRDRMRSYYILITENINKNQSFVLDDITFVRLWNDLTAVCDDICETIFASMARCKPLFESNNDNND